MRSFHHADFRPIVCAPADGERSPCACPPARRRRRSPASSRRSSRCATPASSTRSLVLDDDSRDGTGAIAGRAGAEVVRRPADARVRPGARQGRRDVARAERPHADLVCFVDADTEDFGEHFASACSARSSRPGVQFVKGFFRRPFKAAASVPTGGGRVTELTARPLLAASGPSSPACASRLPARSPRAASCSSGCRSARATRSRSACCSTSTPSAASTRSRRSTSTSRQNHHKPLAELAPMADAVLARSRAACRRAGWRARRRAEARSSARRWPSCARCQRRLISGTRVVPHPGPTPGRTRQARGSPRGAVFLGFLGGRPSDGDCCGAPGLWTSATLDEGAGPTWPFCIWGISLTFDRRLIGCEPGRQSSASLPAAMRSARAVRLEMPSLAKILRRGGA